VSDSVSNTLVAMVTSDVMHRLSCWAVTL